MIDIPRRAWFFTLYDARNRCSIAMIGAFYGPTLLSAYWTCRKRDWNHKPWHLLNSCPAGEGVSMGNAHDVMKPISPEAVLREIAQSIPESCRKNMVIIGSGSAIPP